MPDSNSSSKSAILLLSILGMLVISTLVVMSSYFLRPAVELDLTKKLTENLSKVGMSRSIIRVSGRDVTLYGLVSSKNDAKIAEDIAKRIKGVRHVKNNLLIKAL